MTSKTTKNPMIFYSEYGKVNNVTSKTKQQGKSRSQEAFEDGERMQENKNEAKQI